MFDLIWPIVCAGCDRFAASRLCPSCRPSSLLVPDATFEHIDAARALAHTYSPTGDALKAAKYGHDRQLMHVLAQAMGDAARVLAPPDVVVPVPTTPWRQLRRGFSPATILASAVGHSVGAPVRQPLRVRRGRHQASLDKAQRARALHGRVQAVAPTAGTVWLVDDVVTTGATADAMGMELLCAGAECVRLVTLCATPRRGAAV